MTRPIGTANIAVAILSASVGAVVAFVVAPVTGYFSHDFDAYLNRPIITIENVDIVGPEVVFNIGGADLSGAIGTTFSYMTFVTSHPSDTSYITLYLAQPLIDKESLQKLKDGATSFRSYLAEQRKSIQKTGLLSALMPSVGMVTEAELDKNNSALDALEEKLKDPKIEYTVPMFKVSILNKGATDGLIDLRGIVKFSGDSRIIPIIATNSPTDLSSNSVSVNVVNQNSIETGSTVGKITQRSLVEYWFKIDDKEFDVKTLHNFWELSP